MRNEILANKKNCLSWWIECKFSSTLFSEILKVRIRHLTNFSKLLYLLKEKIPKFSICHLVDQSTSPSP